jgi:hypothetical protein
MFTWLSSFWFDKRRFLLGSVGTCL